MDLCNIFLVLLIICLPILILTSSYLFILLNSTKNTKSRFPPGPKTLPIIGNLHQVGGNPANIRKMAKKYGALMQLQLGSTRALVVSSASMANEIFGSHDPIFSGRPQLYVARKLSYGCNNIAFSPPDEHWKALKRMVIVELLSAKRVHSFELIRAEEVAHMLDSISEPTTGVVDLSQVTLVLASNVLCRAVFGDVVRYSSSLLQELLLETQVLLAEFNLADFCPWLGCLLNKINGFDSRLDRSFKKLDRFFEDAIEEHLRPTRVKVNEDLLDVLLQVQKDPTNSVQLSHNNIKGILLDMFIAGSDPTWATLVWAMTHLMRNPQAMKRAQQEVRDAAKGHTTTTLEETHLHHLTYLKWVINETLRLHPPNPFPRLTTESCTVNGFDIPAKTRVFIDSKTLGRDGQHWDLPDEFRPERFDTIRCSMKCLGDEHGFIPFGVGRRGCPGRGFAMAVMEVALANMLLRFDWRLPEGVGREAVDMEEAVGLTTHKTVSLLLVATPRSN